MVSLAEDGITPDRWRDDLSASYEQIIQVVTDALATKRRVRVERDCKKCGCSHIDFVEIEDVKSAIAAAEFLANRAEGRPGTAQVENDQDRIVFERVVYMAPEGDA